MMKKNELDEFKEILDHLQARLRGDVNDLTSTALRSDQQNDGTESKSPTHMAELGSNTFEQDFTRFGPVVEGQIQAYRRKLAAAVRP